MENKWDLLATTPTYLRSQTLLLIFRGSGSETKEWLNGVCGPDWSGLQLSHMHTSLHLLLCYWLQRMWWREPSGSPAGPDGHLGLESGPVSRNYERRSTSTSWQVHTGSDKMPTRGMHFPEHHQPRWPRAAQP